MKRLVWAAVATVFIFAALYAGTTTVKANCNKVIKAVDYCAASTKSALAHKRAKALKELWDNKKGYVNLFVSHDTVREIDRAITNIQSSAGNLEELKTNCNEAKAIIMQLLSNERFSLDGIF